MGCAGGSQDSAFLYIINNKGVDSEHSYPYEARDAKCRFSRQNVVASDKGVIDFRYGDEDVLKRAVALLGPQAIVIHAGEKSFMNYAGGVHDNPQCSGDMRDLNHAVLLVGYGTDPKGGDYWLVKNSWSDQWGEAGYIRMARNKNNQCGIATYATFPIV